MAVLFFILGLVCLIVGAEALVRGASRLAAAVGVSPLAIGLTVVAFGTSSPELAVSVKAALSDQASIALGNVVGSNIFNVLVILGLSALIAPLVVSRQLIRQDVPLMILLSIAALALGFDGRFGRLEGGALFAGLVAYLALLFYQSRKAGAEMGSDGEAPPPAHGLLGWLWNLALIAVGLALLAVGSKWLVDGAIVMATYLGVTEAVIGLTIVAAGTSLPELVTSLVAALRGARDIAVGNIIGSNIFNIAGVLGLASLIAPSGMPAAPGVMRFDMPIMIAVALACLPIFFTGARISRWEGALLFAYYVAYTLYLALAASQHESLPWMSAAMLYFALPLTAVTLVVIAAREARSRVPDRTE